VLTDNKHCTESNAAKVCNDFVFWFQLTFGEQVHEIALYKYKKTVKDYK
jgi:hypothetical protein